MRNVSHISSLFLLLVATMTTGLFVSMEFLHDHPPGEEHDDCPTCVMAITLKFLNIDKFQIDPLSDLRIYEERGYEVSAEGIEACNILGRSPPIE